MSPGRRSALIAYILFMPGGFILAGTLIVRWLHRRYGAAAGARLRGNERMLEGIVETIKEEKDGAD
jgi:hypothetical protein